GLLAFKYSNSENNSRTSFLKLKTAENRELALWHLFNRLVSENIRKRRKTYGKHVAIGIISTWNIRNYRYV
ncbi:hypothetical protein ACTGZQ_11465, partial [Streptococcus suis]